MLKIEVPEQELWDEKRNEFVTFGGATLSLEHSLVSISKWESKYHKPFITNKPNDVKTKDEMLYYIKCMTVTQNVKDEVYNFLTSKNLMEIRSYMEDPMTATTFSNKAPQNKSNTKNEKPITSEQIYYWMISRNIPIEFQKWHINRLLMLIRVCDFYNEKSNGSSHHKMSKREIMSRNTQLNAARRKALNTNG